MIWGRLPLLVRSNRLSASRFHRPDFLSENNPTYPATVFFLFLTAGAHLSVELRLDVYVSSVGYQVDVDDSYGTCSNWDRIFVSCSSTHILVVPGPHTC